jgi:hypothetical protein
LNSFSDCSIVNLLTDIGAVGLMKKILFSLLLILPSMTFAQKVMELKPSEKPDTFVELMNQNYDPALADLVLEEYLNSLLKANSLSSVPGEPEISYSLKANREGALVVTRLQQLDKGLVRNNKSLSVYGIGYALESQCSRTERRCWVFHPNRDERWVEIAYAPKAVEELAKGMGLLIKELQK